MAKRTLVTAALPYANGPLHLGHLAGAYLPADLYVRYKRLKGDDVIFICGSDEHGVPITLAADKAGVTPRDIVDKYHKLNKNTFDQLGISFDYFGRTSSETHHETSGDFFKKLHDKNVFIEKSQKQLYDPKAGMFLPDRYVQGTCPSCGYDEAYGDQCEKCGSSLSPTELLNPKSVITGETPEYRETNHWFLPLNDFQKWLEEWIESRRNWKPNVAGQCKSWLNEGLNERAVTRDLNWGVPVPLPNTQGKVLYVWFDAPIGYISATKEWAEEQGDPEKWKSYWQDDETQLIHFIGKDNIVFHCIMFPAMLKAHGDYVLPENVPANEFLNLEGRKLSTSRGWAVWLHEYIEAFESDLLRYVLGINLPETRDADFSWSDFQTRVNSELADILGNFIFRTQSFLNRYFEGNVPELINPTDRDREVLNAIAEYRDEIGSLYESFRLKEAVLQSMNLARLGNKYFTEMEPWHLRKTNMERCGTVLHICAQLTAALSLIFDPILPDKMKILRNDLNIDNTGWDNISSELLPAGHAIEKGSILFNKIEDDAIDAQVQKLKDRAGEPQPEKIPELKETAVIDDFAKIDIRSAEVLSAEPIPKSDKLLKVNVDIGLEQRTVLAGVAQQYEPDDLIGKKVLVVSNLKPRKMMGVKSQGMILMSEDPDGNLYLITTDAPPGSIIK